MAATVYVRKNTPTDVGHVSMQVDDVYMSFWPKTAAKAKTDIKIGQSHEAVFPSSYKVDVRLEAMGADNVIRIEKLNQDAMISNWLKFKQQPDQYNMRKSNCSTMIASMLE